MSGCGFPASAAAISANNSVGSDSQKSDARNPMRGLPASTFAMRCVVPHTSAKQNSAQTPNVRDTKVESLRCVSEFAGSVRLPPKSRDPMIGTQNPADAMFVIPQANGAPPIRVDGLSTFVTTKAAAYCFLPSITAIKFIANLG